MRYEWNQSHSFADFFSKKVSKNFNQMASPKFPRKRIFWRLLSFQKTLNEKEILTRVFLMFSKVLKPSILDLDREEERLRREESECANIHARERVRARERWYQGGQEKSTWPMIWEMTRSTENEDFEQRRENNFGTSPHRPVNKSVKLVVDVNPHKPRRKERKKRDKQKFRLREREREREWDGRTDFKE